MSVTKNDHFAQVGFSWFFMVPGWFFMVFHGFSWFFMVFHGFSWFQVGFSWFFHVFSWFQVGFSMVFLQNVPAKNVSWPNDPF